MEHNPVVWFEIYVDDMARAEAFFERVAEYRAGRGENGRAGDVDISA